MSNLPNPFMTYENAKESVKNERANKINLLPKTLIEQVNRAIYNAAQANSRFMEILFARDKDLQPIVSEMLAEQGWIDDGWVIVDHNGFSKRKYTRKLT